MPLADHVPEFTNSPESFAFASQTLQDCLQNHPACSSSSSDSQAHFLPSRLVEVGDSTSKQVRVVETNDIRDDLDDDERYCALSHCWGPPSTITTQLNDERYESYLQGIPLSDLPKTFHDAVLFTRELDCKYIWIDSLCIIQGNRDDWLREGAQMCDIYENSLVTLAAASSPNGHGGLFYEAPRMELVGYDDKTEQDYTVFARFDINHRFFSFPLMNRAWVLQERLLSPRTLYFTNQELVWECRSNNICQCSPVLGGFQNQVDGFPVNAKVQPPTADSSSASDPSTLIHKWHEVIQIYSQLNLTKPADKLMAVDGIAQFMAPIRQTRYLGGLWEDSFAHDLAWRVDMFEDLKEEGETTRPLELEAVAPTWCWASIGAQVLWRDEDLTCEPEESFEVVKWPVPAEPQGVQHWETSSDGDDGEGTPLQVRGVLVKTTMAEADLVVNSSPCFYEDGEEWTPSEGHTKDDEPLYCLRLLQGEALLYSLALRLVGSEEEGVFVRHGMLIFGADPDKENDVWNSRSSERRERFSTRDYQKGYPQWWIGEDVRTITIL